MSTAVVSAVCVVLHDVAAGTQAACERVMHAVADVAGDAAPLTLLAVPRYHGQPSTAAFDRWLGDRSRAGDELVLHGWTHLDEAPGATGWLDRLRRSSYTRGEGEFWALTQAEAAARLRAGRDWFDANGWPARGFVAPAWLLGPGAWAALRETDFAYTCTLRHIHLLPRGRALTSQSVVYSTSAAWRRATSLAWNALVARAERANPLLRLELHPRDADFPAVRRSWQGILESALRERRAVTVGEVAAGLRGTASQQVEAEAGGEHADQRGDQHVARVVQPERDA